MSSTPEAGLHPAIPAGLGGTAVLLACIPLVFAGVQFAAVAAAAGWQSTPGTITTSVSYEAEHRDKREARPVTTLRYDIAYAYTVNHVNYEGSALDPGGFISWEAAEVVARWPQGARTEVWYDPAQPQTAALTRDASGSRFVFLGVGALMLLLGAVFGAVGLRLWLRR